jgi:hypothetical protein
MTYVDALARSVRSVLRASLEEVEGFVRPAKQQPTPIGRLGEPFCTVEIQGLGTVGTPVFRRGVAGSGGTEMDFMLDAYDEFTASVQFFKAPKKTHVSDPGATVDAAGIVSRSQWALSKAQHLVKNMWHPNVRRALHACGLGYIRPRTPPKDLSVLQDSLWESRAQVSLDFGIANRQVTKVALLAGIALQMKFAPPGGAVVTSTLEVPT